MGTALESAIPPATAILIDTSVLLAYLAGSEPGSPDAEELLDRFVSTGRNTASVSVVSVAELLVRPFRTGPAAVATVEGFLRHFAAIRLVDVDYVVAREAARVRAASGLRTPDALIVGSALALGADILITNDRSWSEAVRTVAPTLGVCVLGEKRAAKKEPSREVRGRT